MLDQLIREKAYQIWEAEGYPEGRAETHWEMAKRAVETAAPKPTKRIAKPRTKKKTKA
jgi:hypothetical protein